MPPAVWPGANFILWFLHAPCGQTVSEGGDVFRIFKRGQRRNGIIRVFFHQFFALFKAIQADEGILLSIHAGGFSQLRLGANHVQHIVPNLERQSQPRRKLTGGLKLLLRPTAGNRTQGAGSVDKGAGLP